MASYTTLDYLPDLSVSEMAAAPRLTFVPAQANWLGWDYTAEAHGTEPFAILHGNYSFEGVAGATYDFFSTSYFDPYVLEVFDNQGNVILANDENDDPANTSMSDGGLYSNDAIFDWVAPYTGTYFVDASWHQGDYYNYYSVVVAEDLDTVWGPAGFDLTGTSANESFSGGAGNDTIDGGAGVDNFLATGNSANYTLMKTSTGWALSSIPDGFDRLTGIERIMFADTAYALDIDGNAGKAYRIYQAAFDREPDLGGLGDWIEYLDRGASLADAAAGFVSSPEFEALYGANPTNAELVTRFYNNVLHRAPEQAGFDYWMNQITSGLQTVPDVLSNFSESPENQAKLIGIIGNGFEYIPWG